MVIGLLVALALAVVMLVGGPWLISNIMQYFEADMQRLHIEMYNAPSSD